MNLNTAVLSFQTCAHRYQQRSFVNTPQESHDIIGRCYVLSQDLTIDLSSDEDGGNWKFCEGRSRGHERFGLCQQGLAATFTKDYHYVVFGAPGAYNWKGHCLIQQSNRALTCSLTSFLTYNNIYLCGCSNPLQGLHEWNKRTTLCWRWACMMMVHMRLGMRVAWRPILCPYQPTATLVSYPPTKHYAIFGVFLLLLALTAVPHRLCCEESKCVL